MSEQINVESIMKEIKKEIEVKGYTNDLLSFDDVIVDVGSMNVINIVSGQEYPEGYSYDSIQIQSETKPYGLTVFLKVEPSAVKIEDELQVNADMTFDLIVHNFIF